MCLVGRHYGTQPSGIAPGLTLTSSVSSKKSLSSQMLSRSKTISFTVYPASTIVPGTREMPNREVLNECVCRSR